VTEPFRVGQIVGSSGPKPLDGITILALEQMQALPFATQLLGRLGAEIIKIESPAGGDLGRGSLPAMVDPEGRLIGATFLRNNLSKRSVAVDLKTAEGRHLVMELAGKVDVVAENFRAGAIERLGLGYEEVSQVHPDVIYLSLSGFGHQLEGAAASPYGEWPALASVVEAMSGIYELKREPGKAPTVSPMGALGDISTALFASIGLLAALRQRELTGKGQRVDVAMFDVLVAMTDIVVNFSSLGLHGSLGGAGILDGFEAADGYFVLQVIRERQWAALCEVIGKPEWVGDSRFATRDTWSILMEAEIRPAIEAWSISRSKLDCAEALMARGLAAGPCFSDEEVVADPHLAERHMIVAMERSDGVAAPVLLPGNPIKIAGVPEGPERRVPWLGEHTDEVLTELLALEAEQLEALRAQGVIA